MTSKQKTPKKGRALAWFLNGVGIIILLALIAIFMIYVTKTQREIEEMKQIRIERCEKAKSIANVLESKGISLSDTVDFINLSCETKSDIIKNNFNNND